jgi:predicted PurR-regulated permease PerM
MKDSGAVIVEQPEEMRPAVAEWAARRPMANRAPIEWTKAILLYGIILLLAALVFLIFMPFFVPLGWAAVLAVLCEPWAEPWKARWGATRAAVVGTIGVTLVLIVPALLLMSLFALEGIQAVRNLQEAIATGSLAWVTHAWSWLAAKSGEAGSDLPTLVRDNTSRMGAALAAGLGAVVANIAVFLFELSVTLFALFYFLRDGDAIVETLRAVLPFDDATREEIIAGAQGLIHASVRVSLFLALVQGLVGGLGFAVVGIGSPIFWGIAMAFLSLLPVVGTWPIWIPAVVWLYASGHPARATVLLVICLGMVIGTDNFLRPALLSGSARVNGLLVFVGVLGGVSAFGMLGIVLGPLVIAAAMSVLDVYTRREQPA